MELNLTAAWIAFLAGGLSGAATGLFFHHDDWLGGYNSWRRRMVRLGHIAFFGLGFINLAFALTVDALAITSGMQLPSILFIVGLIAMPSVCYASAIRKGFRNLFFIPALSVIVAIVLVVWRIIPS